MQTLHRSRDRLAGERTASDQSAARDPAGARNGCASGQTEARAVPDRLSWTSKAEPASSSAHDCARRRRSRAMGRTRPADRGFRHGVRPLGEGERRGSSTDDDPRHRRDRGVCSCGRCRSGGKLRTRPRSRCLAGSGSATSSPPGGKPKLLGISKRGNKVSAPTVDPWSAGGVAERDTPLGRWAKRLMSRADRNVAGVAFANKLARIAWAVLRRGERFAAGGMSMAA